MTRLLSTILCDVRIQFRNGFYYAAGFVALFWVLLLTQLSRLVDVPPETLSWLMPVCLLSNLLMNTFYFIAGLVLLEKGEGSLMMLVVTPLWTTEYLASKVITLTLLSLVENTLIVSAANLQFDLTPLLAGMALTSVILVLAGFIAVSRYDSINEYLFPSVLYTLIFVPPFLDYLGLVEIGLLFYLHPLGGPLLVTAAAFQPIELWQWVHAIVYSGLWIGLLLWWSRLAFRQFITAAEGAR